MASRRMFSLRVIGSARFLKMPISSQALYFHLGLRADDDGIVEAFPVIRAVGCTEDDLRVLVAKGYVVVLNEDLVSYITDWNENNQIRPDRKIDSIYKELLVSVLPDAPLIQKVPRASQRKGVAGPWPDNGPQMARIGKDSIGQDSTVKDSKESKRFAPPSVEEVRAYCQEKGYKVDPEAFVAFYESKGWKVGNQPMKVWKSAVVTWAKRDEKAQAPRKTTFHNFENRPDAGGQWEEFHPEEVDDDELEAFLAKRRDT